MAPEALAERIDAAADLGLQPAVHAIGDRANRVVLDAYAARLERDPAFAALRPRIEHAQVVAPDGLARFAALDIVPSVQPTHATSDMRWAEERLGAARLAGAYAWRALGADALALGSDFPVEPADPRLGLYAARTRQDARGEPAGGWVPDQRLDARSALAGFTSGAAFAAHEEGARGGLAPGMFADLTVRAVDPLACAPAELLEARVLMTVIEGEVVFRSHDGGER
jgi:predicted amidohydrolase YtcJ